MYSAVAPVFEKVRDVTLLRVVARHSHLDRLERTGEGFTLRPGSYAINAKLTIFSGASEDRIVRCVLRVGGNIADDTNSLFIDEEVVALQAAVSNFAGGTILVECNENGGGDFGAFISNGVLTAIQVTAVF